MINIQFALNITIGILFLIIYGWLVHIENYLRSIKFAKEREEVKE